MFLETLVADRDHMDFSHQIISQMCFNVQSVVIFDIASDMHRVDTGWQVEGFCHLIMNLPTTICLIVLSSHYHFTSLNRDIHLKYKNKLSAQEET